MRWPDHSFLFPALALLLLAGVAIAAPDATVTNASASVNSTAASNALPDALPAPAINQKIDLPVPVGEPVKGIKIPQYDEKGKMTLCLTADTAKKLDEHQVELSKLKVQFTEKEDQEIIVEIPHSILDLETKILTADTETTIHRPDFEIVGESATFDTIARQGSFKGHVHASFLNGAPIDLTVKP
jgi:hypothetical protein